MKKFNPGSSNFESYRLDITPDLIRVRATGKAMCFYALFAVIGLGCMIGPLVVPGDSGKPLWQIILFGAVFFLVGAGLMYWDSRRRYPCIDLRERMFYPLGKGRETLDDLASGLPLSNAERLELSATFEHGNDSSYISYNLSLVYPGEEKYLLLRHGSKDAMIRDANLLAQSIGLPLQEDDSVGQEEEEVQKETLGGGIFLLIFGALWTSFSAVMLFLALTYGGAGIGGIIFIGVFFLFGLLILGCAIKVIASRFAGKK